MPASILQQKGIIMNRLNQLDKAELLMVRSLLTTDSYQMGQDVLNNNIDKVCYEAIIKVNAAIILKLSRQIRALEKESL